jgi:hypothetical protein
MRLTCDITEGRRKYQAGLRKCDTCGKIDTLRKSSRWDICKSCVRKENWRIGKHRPPKNTTKLTRINFCEICNKVYAISNEYLRKQKYCSSDCFGKTLENRSPVNKIWEDKSERTKFYYRRNMKNIFFRIKIMVRSRIKSALKTEVGKRKYNKNIQINEVEKYIGCTIEQLKVHIESQFQEGMTWENWSRHGWHIDHIYPISQTKSQTKEDLIEELKMISNYKNLRPMWATENSQKHAKIIISLEEVLMQPDKFIGENYE